MSKRIINKIWVNRMREKIHTLDHIDETISFNSAAQWLITTLATENIPFKVYNLGAGVKRITTDVDTCPCCKRKIGEAK